MGIVGRVRRGVIRTRATVGLYYLTEVRGGGY